MVQLYVRDVESSLPMPLKQLRAFSRVHLKRGEKQVVRFELRPTSDFTYCDVRRRADVVEPGEFELQVGASSQDIRLKGLVQVR